MINRPLARSQFRDNHPLKDRLLIIYTISCSDKKLPLDFLPIVCYTALQFLNDNFWLCIKTRKLAGTITIKL